MSHGPPVKHLDGYNNKQHVRFCASENPRLPVANPLHPEGGVQYRASEYSVPCSAMVQPLVMFNVSVMSENLPLC
jgi:hypothetical protein